MPGKTLRSKTAIRRLHERYAAEYGREMTIAFLLQDWDDPYNVGGMFRVADAVGARELIMTGHTPLPPHPQIHVTSMGHHRRIPFRYFEHHEEAVARLKLEGYHLVAIEIAEDAKHYKDYSYPEKVCFVVGNEVNGVYNKVLAMCDGAVFIPMAGKGKSLNVVVAAAIVAFEAWQQPEEHSTQSLPPAETSPELSEP
ncbi:MAG: TrmH family RNA methyltransferase [Armatimonadota bacterium]